MLSDVLSHQKWEGSISAMAGSSAEKETKRSKDDRPHLPFRHVGGLKVVQQGIVSAQADARGDHMLISDPSRKCKHRSTPTASVASRDHEKRQMEKHMSSVRRYVNGGRLGEIFELLTKDQQNDCIQAQKSISKIWGNVSNNSRARP